jgi:tetraacyldisaccharide 4'-kinase
MTEKDAVKCMAFAPPDSWYLEVSAEVDEAAKPLVMEIMNKLDYGRKTA